MSTNRLFVSILAGVAMLASLADHADAQPTRGRRARHLNPRTHDAVEQPARALAILRQETALDVALGYLRAHRDVLGLTAADLDDIRVSSQLVSEHTGVTHIYLRQRFNGIEVHGADINVNVTKDGRVLSGFGSSFVPNLAAAIRNQSPEATAVESATTAAGLLGLTVTRPIEVLETIGGAAQEARLSDGGISEDPITAKLVYERLESGDVVLSWQLEIAELSGAHWWSVSVDAQTRDLLEQQDYIVRDFWGGAPAAESVTEVASTADDPLAVVPIPGVPGSGTYRVHAWPNADPNDGPRALVSDPADAVSSPFGWQDTDGLAGAESTQTVGNNVDAYLDRANDNTAVAGERADGGPGLDFDFAADLTLSPSTYQPAAVTNLFYWNNLMHDISYRYGFTEAAGNFQVNNYGRFTPPAPEPSGAGDQVRAEAQDGGGMNNANFGTNVDGIRPRMQMFLWVPPGGYRVQVQTGPVGEYFAARANFGAFLSDIFVTQPTAEVVLASPANACAPLVGLAAGSIAYVDPGGCNSVVKATNAQNAGAAGIIINTNQSAANLAVLTGVSLTVNIPVLGISAPTNAILRPALPFAAKMAFLGTPAPLRDGDFDAVVVAHEYTHGISNRLTGGRLNVSCLNNDEQMGEGWSDWIALAFTHDPLRAVQRTRGLGPYIRFTGVDGPGIRPTPYSTDLTIDPATYDDIKTLAIPHGVGYAWASMLWEVYWNLIDKHGFNPNVYEAWNTGGNSLAIQLVMDGMKMQVCRPGFVDGRDAILQADQALTNGQNQCAVWKGFAKRGLGFSAIQGDSDDVDDGAEAFDLPPVCQAGIAVSPTSLVSSLTRSSVEHRSLEIRNTSAVDGTDLTWTISETASDCSTPTDLPWVSASVLSGITAPQKTAAIDVVFEAGLMPIGSFTGKLCISTNASATPTEVPLTLNVIYKFFGFFPPVDNPPALNAQNAGSTVPVKFSIDASESDAFAPGFPASRQVDCTTHAALGPLVPTTGMTPSDVSTPNEIYLWRTDREWGATCRELVVGLNDGTQHNAFFQFK
jgi:extracellular elastinolytic metalloproteinase